MGDGTRPGCPRGIAPAMTGLATETDGISALSTVLENKPAARGGVADKLAFFNGLQSVTNTIHATTHLDEIILDLGAGHLQPVRRRPPHDLCRLRRRQVDRHQGQDGSQFVQGLQAAGHGPERRRLRRVPQAGHQHPRRLRREGARVLQPASQLPAGGRRQDRLPHQADAGGAGGRCANQGADRRRAAHQHAVGRAVPAGDGGRRRAALPKRWRSRCASASGR